MPTEIRLETVAQYVQHEHDLFATCPSCHSYKEIDTARLIAKGLGDKALRDLRLRCKPCGVQVEITVRHRSVRTMVMEPERR